MEKSQHHCQRTPDHIKKPSKLKRSCIMMQELYFFFNQNSNIHSCGAKGPQVKKNLPVYLLLHSEFFRSTFFLHHLRNFWVHEIQITIMISVCIFLEKIMLKILKLEKIQTVYEIFRWFPPREKKDHLNNSLRL